MAILFGFIAVAACTFYVHVLIQFVRESQGTRAQPGSSVARLENRATC